MFPFGTRGLTYTKGRGDFHCPRCKRWRPYLRRRVRSYLTLVRLPVLPLDTLGEFVECVYCAATYLSEVAGLGELATDRKTEAEFQRAIRRVMVLMMMADGELADSERAAIQRIHRQVIGVELSDEDLQAELEQARQENQDVNAYLGDLRAKLNRSGKELVLSAAYHVAAADGVLRDQELVLLLKLADALELPVGRFNDLMDYLRSR